MRNDPTTSTPRYDGQRTEPATQQRDKPETAQCCCRHGDLHADAVVLHQLGVELEPHLQRHAMEGRREIGCAVTECAGEQAGREQGNGLHEANEHGVLLSRLSW
ncbi:hypothetical protein [Nocardia altamirensis]|uniref:hypothetical protein n=1 Tax=Nocardia altamirensis TaxID=472158 RepID=UPI001FDFD609|nr:hypothetical protein [Nocardia altamirensis]